MGKILIIYTKMVVGGSTTSLLSILNNIDYNKYKVDLLLLDKTGDLQHLINKNVNVIGEELRSSKFIRFCTPTAIIDRLCAYSISKKKKNRLIKAQINSTHLANSMSSTKNEYDVAISFLEFWPLRYLAYKVKAPKKIGWIHIDPVEAGLEPKYSQDALSRLDTVVLVSNSCKSNFDRMFPMFKNKSIVIENILDSKIIRKMSEETVKFSYSHDTVNLVTVCRINLASKALYRVIDAFVRLKKEGHEIEKIMNWYVIGDGPDFDSFKSLVEKSDVSCIKLLGKQLNPYKFEKYMDYFILPSKYEGKPMAVTEAQMLGLVPIVCNYSSAKEQIEHEIDGYIAENTDEGIYVPLKRICENNLNFEQLKKRVLEKEYSNLCVMNDIYKIFRE